MREDACYKKLFSFGETGFFRQAWVFFLRVGLVKWAR